MPRATFMAVAFFTQGQMVVSTNGTGNRITETLKVINDALGPFT
jgi:hypothetical protein